MVLSSMTCLYVLGFVLELFFDRCGDLRGMVSEGLGTSSLTCSG